jgi:hypothetical protein
MTVPQATELLLPFQARFVCTVCGPTNRVVGDHDGIVCVACNQRVAHEIVRQALDGPDVAA